MELYHVDYNCRCKSLIHYYIWRPPSQSELTPMVFNTGLTHLGSDASIYSNAVLKYQFLIIDPDEFFRRLAVYFSNTYTVINFMVNKGYFIKIKVKILNFTHNLSLSQKLRLIKVFCF